MTVECDILFHARFLSVCVCRHYTNGGGVALSYIHLDPLPAPYMFSVVGTSRCDVRAACSGATPWNAIAARIFVPPATTRAGTAQRAIPTIALNRYKSPHSKRSRDCETGAV